MEIEWNYRAFDAIRRSPEVVADLERRARAIRAAAGGDDADFEVETFIGRSRARVTIRTANRAGMLAEARDRALTRAMEAGRG